jgi:hypothetical protein
MKIITILGIKLAGLREILEARVGIEPKTMLKTQKLLILLNAKNAKNTESGQAGYTASTRQPGIFDAAGVCATNCGAAVTASRKSAFARMRRCDKLGAECCRQKLTNHAPRAHGGILREPLLTNQQRSHAVVVRARIEKYVVTLTPGSRLRLSGRASGTAVRREHVGHAVGCHPDRSTLGG